MRPGVSNLTKGYYFNQNQVYLQLNLVEHNSETVLDKSINIIKLVDLKLIDIFYSSEGDVTDEVVDSFAHVLIYSCCLIAALFVFHPNDCLKISTFNQ